MINIGYEAGTIPFLGAAYYAAGAEQRRQRLEEEQLRQQQQAMQWQQNAQQMAMQNYAHQQNAWQHQQAMQLQWAEAMQRNQLYQQHYAQQAQNQQQQNEQGMYYHAMNNITALEKEGFQYNPAQQETIRKLDAARERVMSDPAAGPEQRQQAMQSYWQQRSGIRPSQPKPIPPQEQFDKSKVQHTFEDGTTVWGTMGMRNGVPVFDPIENPNQKQQDKVALAQQKLDFTAQQNLQKLQHQDAAMQQKWEHDQALHQMKMDQERDKIQMGRVKAINDAYIKLHKDTQALNTKMAVPGKYGEDIKGRNAVHQAGKQQLLDDFKAMHGRDFSLLYPEQAQQMGIPAWEPPGATPQGSFQQGEEQPVSPTTTPKLGQIVKDDRGRAHAYTERGWAPVINSEEERNALPEGATYVAPNGQVFVKGRTTLGQGRNTM